jgi:hypothetical protein
VGREVEVGGRLDGGRELEERLLSGVDLGGCRGRFRGSRSRGRVEGNEEVVFPSSSNVLPKPQGSGPQVRDSSARSSTRRVGESEEGSRRRAGFAGGRDGMMGMGRLAWTDARGEGGGC